MSLHNHLRDSGNNQPHTILGKPIRNENALDRELTDDTDRDPDHAEDELFSRP